jgi:hypothetical protein
MHEPPVAMKQSDFIDIFLTQSAEFGGERFGFGDRGGAFKDGEGFKQMVSGDFFARFARRHARRPRSRLRAKRIGSRKEQASERQEEASRHEETSPDSAERRMNGRSSAGQKSLFAGSVLRPSLRPSSHFLRPKE